MYLVAKALALVLLGMIIATLHLHSFKDSSGRNFWEIQTLWVIRVDILR